MKYKDYLIIPIILIYIVATSFAYVGKNEVSDVPIDAPQASVCPEDINLGTDVWYAEGSRNSDAISASSVSRISYEDMHMLCATNEGKNYDLIFVDSMTAYDCNTGTYYERADFDTLVKELSSGKFINSSNYKDYFVFEENGKSIEYYGDKVYKGEWSFDTSDTLLVYDNACRGYIGFDILFDVYGDICGISNSDYVYNLVT